ncbi:MAG: hypothetical protein U0518_05775 [Candidatus Gracilibacteria bacterium]
MLDAGIRKFVSGSSRGCSFACPRLTSRDGSTVRLVRGCKLSTQLSIKEKEVLLRSNYPSSIRQNNVGSVNI